MTIRVAIVEDQRLVRELLAALLGQEPHVSVVGAASTGSGGIELAGRLLPDVVLLDVSLPDMDGIAVAQILRQRHPEMRVIALSVHDESHYVRGMLEAGVQGYVHKSAAIHELREAICTVMRGETYVSPPLRIATRSTADAAVRLGRREREVLALLAEGQRSSEIARQLGISAATVEVHRRNIMRKLDLHSIAELTKYALRHGLTPP